MRDYEVMFILDPALDEEVKNSTIENVKNIINEDGEAGEADVWGNKKLAYQINKKKEGFYASTELPKELDRRLKISDAVMRHIIVCQDEN